MKIDACLLLSKIDMQFCPQHTQEDGGGDGVGAHFVGRSCLALTMHRGDSNVGIMKGQIICVGVEMDAPTTELLNVDINSWTNTNLNLKGVGSPVLLDPLAVKCEITKLFLWYFRLVHGNCPAQI